MYVKIRNSLRKPGDDDLIVTISKLSLIQEIHEKIYQSWNIPVEKQRLYYKGKQLNHDECVIDYDVKLNDVIQLMIKADNTETKKSTDDSDKENEPESSAPTRSTPVDWGPSTSIGVCVDESSTSDVIELSSTSDLSEVTSKYYKQGDRIDFLDMSYGAWFEGIILNIFKSKIKMLNQKTGTNSEVMTHSISEKMSDTNLEDTTDTNPRDKLSEKGSFDTEDKCDKESTCESKVKSDSKSPCELEVKSDNEVSCELKVKSDNESHCELEVKSDDKPAYLLEDESESNKNKHDDKLNGTSDKNISDYTTSRDTKLQNLEPNLTFRVKMETEDDADEGIYNLSFDLIRPRAYYKLTVSELKPNQTIMVNYNIEEPHTRGYWYDLTITSVNSKILQGTILVGNTLTKIKKSNVKFLAELMRIEKPVLLKSRNEQIVLPQIRKTFYYCQKCKDSPTKTCKECGCQVCKTKSDSKLLLLCDDCNDGYHTYCLDPPLSNVPEEPQWFCPNCKVDVNEIVQPGEKRKTVRKKRSNTTAASSSKPKRDWGQGMACIGYYGSCTIVSPHHFGPIPGIDVGTTWLFRSQVALAGVHRPPVAGIHGTEKEGAYSIVFSGGYEDDIDNGSEFIYSGSGGRDLSQNRRTNEQSADQVLTRMNKALALNCDVALNEKGAESSNWRNGKSVRVVRSFKNAKNSKYAPKAGYRYDGIYKVVKYYPEKGKSGYLIWKYLFRRDDPSPFPWSKKAPQYDMIYPPGYHEALKEDGKRLRSGSASPPKNNKKQKVSFKLDSALSRIIDGDTVNVKLWDGCKEFLQEGKVVFLEKVKEAFVCVCCQEVVHNPITTKCKHNVCKKCLQRSFAAEIFSCPICRFELGQEFKMILNMSLAQALSQLFPGYEGGR
ncbi:hypothetical protein FQA39_LY00340 [Lamprigera yunnana]|nr:hypothetical protein FQA39_LY00340 [Lamprigera yunnana]